MYLVSDLLFLALFKTMEESSAGRWRRESSASRWAGSDGRWVPMACYSSVKGLAGSIEHLLQPLPLSSDGILHPRGGVLTPESSSDAQHHIWVKGLALHHG